MNGKRSMVIAFMIMAPLFYVVFSSMVSVAIQIIYTLFSLYMQGSGEPYADVVMGMGICSGLYIPIVYFVFFQKDGRRNGPAAGLPWLVTLGAGLCLGMNILISVSGISHYFDDYSQLAEQIYRGNLITEILAVGVIGPVAEELIFRGVIYKGFRTFFRPLWAVLLSAVFFGLYHGNMVQFLYAGCLGVVLAMVYERYRHIIAPVLVHMSANITSILTSDAKPVQDFLATGPGSICILALLALGLIVSPIVIWKLVPSTKKAAGELPVEKTAGSEERKEEIQQEPPEDM